MRSDGDSVVVGFRVVEAIDETGTGLTVLSGVVVGMIKTADAAEERKSISIAHCEATVALHNESFLGCPFD